MTDSAPILKLLNVSKSYPSPDGKGEVAILKDISLEVKAGESLAIIGPSGSGKSTLLNIIGTLDRPTTGKVLLQGDDLTQLNDDQLAWTRNRRIGFIFQAHHLLPQCTVLENVLIPTLALKPAPSANETETRARQLLDRVGLGSRLTHRPGQLSGGERQRVAVVRALINRPKILLADEPTGALDRASSQKLAQLLVELNREQGVVLILVTHALELARQMQRPLHLQDGALVPAPA